ncbi:hypothetical protein DNTS_011683 [Danionella cerebrum]|uniref:Uncharacterized protein n=1 Tax=Danionella cerebrum TaxID=2873325 RepID=A0A553QTC5_9TELE|nr:hypothetical protein DNTS_025170 [Danionella translucida]TRY94252.1 hypothetical protein DNTS_011683 [Danionella translucida]
MLENEKIADGKSEQAETGLSQNSEASASSKRLKKKKKKAADGKRDQRKECNSTEDKSVKEETIEMSPEEQLSRELDWCIEQLELGLRTQKTSSKQREDATHALKTLRSTKAPLVKKRQVMRAISGDYRKKMEEERTKQFKLIQSATTSARVTSVSDCKPVFHRRMEKKTHPRNKEKSLETNKQNPQAEGETKPFVFTKTNQEFCFNFDL